MIICITTQKGGTGKTTTAATLGAGLARRGNKVLLVDTDQQGSLSLITGADLKQPTTLSLLTGELPAKDIVQKLTNNLYIIPATKTLTGAEDSLNITGGEYRLREALEPIRDKFDYIILDTPPALGRITINALTAANEVIIPAQAEILSLAGITALNDSIELVRKYTNPAINVAGILLVKHNTRAVLKRDMEEVMRTQTAPQIHTKVFAVTIREAVAINEAQYSKQSIFEYAGASNVAADYDSFINEFLAEQGRN